MKAVTFFATILGISVGAGLTWWLIAIFEPPAWALLSTFATCAVVLHAAHGIKRDLARIQCELSGHGYVEFKKYQERAYCPRCKDVIATRPIESEGPGMQSGEDTLHQRISRLEEVLGVKE
jgi:hypothetical protein